MSSILTVSQLNKYVGFKIKSDVKLKGIAVSGEVSNLSVYYKTGHIYFSLKDENSVLKAVMFASNAEKLRFPLENGMNVIAFGNIDVYERDGVYQINVSDIQPVGAGAQQLSLEALKNKLQKMGVFSADIKRKIPERPKKIAVVTSAEGAALHDIINVVSRRCPLCVLEVFPTAVQGFDAPKSIEKAIRKADKSGADTMIIARGGGSAEDLKAFNAEQVVLAVYDCVTPVISAVGHETDTSLTDYAADLRAPTPSAAAEIAVPDLSAVYGDVKRIIDHAKGLLLRKITENTDKLSVYSARLMARSPKNALIIDEERLISAYQRLNKAYLHKLESLDYKLMESSAKVSALSPFNVLERGYSITFKDDIPVKSQKQLELGDKISIRFANGEAKAEITALNN